MYTYIGKIVGLEPTDRGMYTQSYTHIDKIGRERLIAYVDV